MGQNLSTQIANKVAEYIEKPHSLSDLSKGWDCLNLLFDFYRSFGYQFPEVMDDITEANYAEAWQSDPDKARRVFSELLRSLGDPVPRNLNIRGDLLLFRGADLPVFWGIDLGNGNMLMVFKEGVQVVPFEPFSKILLEARRLIKNQINVKGQT